MKKSQKKYWNIEFVVGFVLLFCLSAGAEIKQGRKEKLEDFQFEQMSVSAPKLVFKNSHQTLEQLKPAPGQLVLLHIWASWCLPCQKEIPELIHFVQSMPGQKIKLWIVSVDAEEKRQAVEKILKSAHYDREALIAQKTPDSDKYHAWGVPMTYLMNQNLEIVGRARGAKNWQIDKAEQFEQFISEHFLK